jgi:hypothetical protein
MAAGAGALPVTLVRAAMGLLPRRPRQPELGARLAAVVTLQEVRFTKIPQITISVIKARVAAV